MTVDAALVGAAQALANTGDAAAAFAAAALAGAA